MRAVKSVSIDSERRVIITYLDGSTETLYPNCIWCDSEALRQLIKDLLEEKADAITQTIENVTIASFADGADEGLIKKLLVSIDPIQEGSGDPSPDNVRPISGRTGASVWKTGKNLLNPIDMKQWYITGSNKVNVSSDNRMIIVPIKKNTVYVFTHVRKGVISGNDDWNVLLFPEYPVPDQTQGVSTGGNQFIDGSRSFNSGNNTYAALKICNITKTDYDATLAACQFELGSTATDYEPYKGSTYSVNWETEAGTVYGGTIDVVSGKLTVDRAMVTLDGTRYTLGGRNTFTNVARYYVNQSIQLRARGRDSLVMADRATPSYDATIGISNNTPTGYYIWVHGSNTVFITLPVDVASSNAEATAWLVENPIQFVYELATPTEIQLTPQEVTTLLGNNNIWADSGNILELEYTADTKLYIGEQQSGTSGALGSGRQTNVNPDLQPASEKTLEDVEAYKEDTDERGEE